MQTSLLSFVWTSLSLRRIGPTWLPLLLQRKTTLLLQYVPSLPRRVLLAFLQLGHVPATAHSIQALNLPCATKRKTFMTVIQWRAAFDRYALAAHATGQLPLHLAMAHADNVMRICDEGKAKGRPLFLGVIYDQLARRKWADKVPPFRALARGSRFLLACIVSCRLPITHLTSASRQPARA